MPLRHCDDCGKVVCHYCGVLQGEEHLAGCQYRTRGRTIVLEVNIVGLASAAHALKRAKSEHGGDAASVRLFRPNSERYRIARVRQHSEERTM